MGAIFAPTNFKPHKKRTEENIQLRVSNYIRKNYPHVIFVSDYAAGLNLTNGQRMRMMAMRSHDGQPDIMIDAARHGYHGLRIELKKEGTVIYKRNGELRKQPYTRKYKSGGKIFIKKGDHLADQAAMLERYNKEGYLARFAIGYENAIKLIDGYFGTLNQEFAFLSDDSFSPSRESEPKEQIPPQF
ncbi:MAG: hypothetical protein KGZ81_07175 [Flavobacteriales bacterium]|nr:hypothetical protein [Flavobacteriales bacterium]